ncbi:general transcription factor IIF subunit 1 isoform X1 [Chelonia mydas]|uniref:general transcription factor IIF subunit 1 isoform X1 n=1 Tax=Chelonia mydas TaxID=8469 RepID=UPI001CA9A2A1|nr:general transcription factor IIF subunit 1 isoform X1 [Chelonia mydas]
MRGERRTRTQPLRHWRGRGAWRGAAGPAERGRAGGGILSWKPRWTRSPISAKMTSLGTSSQSVTEYVVRVPKNTPKKYNIMAFNAADKVNFTTWHQAKMERDLSNKKIYQEEEMPESGAGSEFNRKLREEARRKKYGIVLREFKPEDQPWILKVNGKAGRKFKGVKKGGVTENASYYIFTQCPDGAFEAFPVSNWYNFTPVAKHRTLTAEEAEEEWERRNKVLNHFTIMQQRRLKDQDDEEEEKEKKTKKKSSELKIHDLEDDLEMSSDESELSDADATGEKAAKPQKKTPLTKKKKKKKKGSDDEAFEDSDDGDFEGQEVDYMSDGSSSSQEEATVGKPKVTKEEDGPKGIDEASESSEESEEEKPAEEKEEEEEEKKAPTPQEKKKKKDSSDESETSEESDIDSEASSALFMAKRKTPPKKERKGSASSSRGDSRPGTPPVDPGSTSSTLRAAASKLEQGKRQSGSGDLPAAKRLKLDSGPQTTSGKSTPQPQSGKSTPSSGDVQLTEEAVRRYLTRKPMTTKDLLKKFQTKKTGLSSEQTVNVLAQILKRLNPERKMINDKMHFFLKE